LFAQAVGLLFVFSSGRDVYDVNGTKVDWDDYTKSRREKTTTQSQEGRFRSVEGAKECRWLPRRRHRREMEKSKSACNERRFLQVSVVFRAGGVPVVVCVASQEQEAWANLEKRREGRWKSGQMSVYVYLTNDGAPRMLKRTVEMEG
jgi:hypothetical protein